jgi:hypothetical protein
MFKAKRKALLHIDGSIVAEPQQHDCQTSAASLPIFSSIVAHFVQHCCLSCAG